jgi:UDP-N-acetylmuramoyl-tripeptide--D-alanyl-D-alanine ligase
MIVADLQRAARWMGGRLVHASGGEAEFEGVSTDTRSLTVGQLFFALRGPNFDAHDKLSEAVSAGAKALVTEREVDAGVPCIVVDDTRRALGALAAAWRLQFDLPLVAITGSNGKTTTKDMVAAIFSQAGPTLATTGNFNNEIGLPLTLLNLAPHHRYAVVEMGANHAGEIAALCEIARPTIAVITNAARAHLEGFGSVEGVAQAKAEIFEGLAEGGTAIINADDAFAASWRERAKDRRILSFGLGDHADIHASQIESRQDEEGGATRFELHAKRGEVSVALRFVGQHMVQNALAAAAACLAAGLDLSTVADGLAVARPVPGRLQLLRPTARLTVLDDCYNANPDSVAAGLAVLAEMHGERWFVFGDLLEIGPDGERLHREVGQLAARSGVTRLLTVGEAARHASEAFGGAGEHYIDAPSLLAALDLPTDRDVAVLVKGSNAMGLDRVVKQLTHTAPPAAEVG